MNTKEHPMWTIRKVGLSEINLKQQEQTQEIIRIKQKQKYNDIYLCVLLLIYCFDFILPFPTLQGSGMVTTINAYKT